MQRIEREGPDGMIAAAELKRPDTRTVVELYRDMVYRIALTHTRCRSDADDVFQEVFLVYHRKQPDCANEEHRKAWLINTTINCSRQLTGSSWSKKVVPLHDADLQPAEDDRFHFRSDAEDAVLAALQELPLPYRTVLHLFYFEDQPIAQIATTLGIAPGTVKVQLSRGRAQIRTALKGEYFDD
jgi:RNA polymerase sigma-70 factor (ECF subfamily)